VTSSPAPEEVSSPPPNGRDSGYNFRQDDEPVIETRPVQYAPRTTAAESGTAPYVPSDNSLYQPAAYPAPAAGASVTAPAPQASTASLLVPRGAVEMLPNESVVFQLGALYLTNKRVILLAPSVLRTAFLRDVDAIGTLTERASGWSFFFGLLLLGLAGAAVYFSVARTQWEPNLPAVYAIDPRIVAGALAILAIYLLVNYFFWVKRTLFLSVGGRPLITVSVTDWNPRKLEGMDAFVNAYSQVKDAVNASEPVE
jgi:hypothetical protein